MVVGVVGVWWAVLIPFQLDNKLSGQWPRLGCKPPVRGLEEKSDSSWKDEDLISLAESTWLIEKIGAEEWKELFFLLFSVCLFLFPPPPPTTCNLGFSAAVARVRRKQALLVRLIGPQTLCQDRG